MDTEVIKSDTPDKDGSYTVHIVYYLSKEDKSYEKSLVYDIDRTSKEWLAGYSGRYSDDSTQEEIDAYNKWYNSLPRIWAPQSVNRLYGIIPQHISDTDLKVIVDQKNAQAEAAQSAAASSVT